MTQKAINALNLLSSSEVASVAQIAGSLNHDYLDKYDVAHILKVSVRTIEKWTRERKIPYYKAGYHTVRYRLADIARAMRKNHFVEEVAVE
jgi:excisionase family DNA binding protein